ncbi:MAG TPA: methyltransferase [bacterium]|nr:methyltransferase [bacterium]
MVKSSYDIASKLRQRERTFRSVGGLFSKDRIAKSTRILIDNVNVNPGDRVLDYGCGYGALGIALADSAPGVDVRMVDSDIRAVRWAQENVRANGVKNAHIVLDHTLDRYSDGDFNVIALNPPIEDGTEAIFEMIDRARPKLRNGGSFYLVAKVRKGAKSYMRRISETIGPAKVISKSGGYWLMRAERSPVKAAVPIDMSVYEHTVETQLRGRKYTFCTRAGIFSRKEMDDGTRLLIESVEIQPMNSVIDVGCGYGPIGIAAAHMASVGRVVMVDTSARAVECASRNIVAHHLHHARKNGKPRVEAIVSDRFDAVKGERFDRVISNPPFHSGVDVLYPLVDEAYAHLRFHGRMYLVLMRYVGIKRHIEKVFGNCEVVAHEGKHTVLTAERMTEDPPGAR